MLQLSDMNRTALLYLTTETGPVLAFFIAGQISGFTSAVIVLMTTTTVASAVSWYLERHLPVLPILSACIVLVGGAITLLFDNPDAVILGDTVYYGLISAVLGISLLRKQLLLKQLFGRVFAMTDQGWWVLSRNWFVILATATLTNEIVRLAATPEFWVDYRFYKTLVILAFASSQFYVSRKYRVPETSNAWGIRLKGQDNQSLL